MEPNKQKELALAILALLILVGLGWWLYKRAGAPAPAGEMATTTAPESLGSELYTQVEESSQSEVPAPTPVTSPIKNIYKNPF